MRPDMTVRSEPGAGAARPGAKVALLSRIVGGNDRALRRLREAGVEVVLDLPGYQALGGDMRRWHAAARGIDALVVGLQPVDRALIDAAPRLRYVLRMGTGVDNVDLAAAGERGVRVANLAGMNADAVAEYAFALLLAAAKRVPEADASVRAGQWRRFTGRHLGGRTLGLVGFGDIGRAMVPMAQGFGMDVLVHRRTPDPEADARYGVRTVPLDDLLAGSDFVSLHAPLTEQTKNLIGARELALMRPGAVFVNTARGELVDEAALAAALARGHLGACGLDVFAAEPPGASPLLDLPRVVVSPHNGAYSDQAVDAMAAAAVDALLEGLARPADLPDEQGASA